MKPNSLLSSTIALWLSAVMATAALQISEVRIDMPGADNDEYIEIKGDPGESLDDVWYIVIGDHSGPETDPPFKGSGTVEFALDLSGDTIQPDGLYLIAEFSFTLPTDQIEFSVSDLQALENSDNVTHLLVRNYTGPQVIDQAEQWGDLAVDIDAEDDGVVDTPTPWSEIIDGVSFIESPTGIDTEINYADALGVPGIGPDGQFVPGHLYRASDDNNWYIGPFALDDGVDSPGTPNPVAPEVDTTPEVFGFDSLYVSAGDTVTVSGSRLDNLTAVIVGGEEAAFTAVDSTQFTFVIPQNTTDGSVVVSTSGGTTTAESTLIILGENNSIVYFEDFEGAEDLGSLNFEFISVSGSKTWFRDSFSGDNFAEMSGWQDDADSNDWLITPAIDLSGALSAQFAFASAKNFNGPDVVLLVSNDYTGNGNPDSASWIDITPDALSDGGYVEVNSGLIDVSDFISSATYFAFVYTSSPDEAATWQLDDFAVIIEGGASPDGSIFENYDLGAGFRLTPIGFIYDELFPFIYILPYAETPEAVAFAQWLFVIPVTSETDESWYFYSFRDDFWGVTGTSQSLYSWDNPQNFWFEWDGSTWAGRIFP